MASNKTKNQIKMPQIKSLIILIIYWLAQIFFSVFYVELHSTAIVQGVVCTCLFSRKKRIFIEGFQFRNFHCKIQFKNIHKSLPTNNWLVWEFKQTNIRKNTSKYSIKKEKEEVLNGKRVKHIDIKLSIETYQIEIVSIDVFVCLLVEIDLLGLKGKNVKCIILGLDFWSIFQFC